MIELNKIYNMDCLEGMDLMIEQGIKVNAIITDIPYGTTKCKWDTVIPFDEMWLRLKQLRFDSSPIVLFGNEPFSSTLRMSNISEYKYDWKWIKSKSSNFLNAKKQPLRTYEDICVFYKKQCIYNPQMIPLLEPRIVKRTQKTIQVTGQFDSIKESVYTESYPKNVLEFSSEMNLHPTQKPIGLLEYLIKTYSNEGDIILDFTIGSGTTAIACINTGRNYIGFELDKIYYDISNQRIGKLVNAHYKY